MAFDIKIGADAAQQAFAKKEAEEIAQLVPGPAEVTKGPIK